MFQASWYDRFTRFYIQTVPPVLNKGLRKVGTESVKTSIEQETQPPSFLENLFISRWLGSSETIMQDKTVFDYLRFDRPLMMAAVLLHILSSTFLRFLFVFRRMYSKHEGVAYRQAQLDYWLPTNTELPVFQTRVHLLEFALNNLCLDALYVQMSQTTYTLDTTFLNDCERYPDTCAMGGILHLSLVDHTFHVVKIEYLGGGYTGTALETVAHDLLVGLLVYNHFYTHLYRWHYEHAFKQCLQINLQELPESHPIREVLLPLAVAAGTSISFQTMVQGTEGSLFEEWFPLTFRGARSMVEYCSRHKTPRPNPDPREEHDLPQIERDLQTWKRYLETHMSHIVDIVYASDEIMLADIGLLNWLKQSLSTPLSKRMLVEHMSEMFLNQVRHNLSHSHIYTHLIRHFIILHPKRFSLGKKMEMLTLFHGLGTLDWVTFTNPQTFDYVSHDGVRTALSAYYAGLHTLNVYHRLTKPEGTFLSVV